MVKNTAKKLDEQMAAELDLTLSPFTMVLKHVVRLPNIVEGFIFVMVKDGIISYDRVDKWAEVNGMRLRVPRFKSHSVIEKRLNDKLYRRWYVWGNGILYPLQTSKVEDLKDNFYFKIDSNPHCCTIHIPNIEVDIIRNNPLLFFERAHPGWGVTLTN